MTREPSGHHERTTADSDGAIDAPHPFRRAVGRPQEAARQLALETYDILDTAPEQAYDDIVLLARMVCDAPVAMVAFIDGDRQWFKARAGLAQSETPRSDSLCDIAAQSHEGTFVVRDLHAEADLAMRPADVDGVPLRFYAGVPLHSPDGFALGALCVLDREPRELTAAQKSGLEALARQTGQLLELRRLGRRQHLLLRQKMQAAQQLERVRVDMQSRNDALNREASLDPLTGLLNRNALRKLRANPEAMQRLDAGIYTLVVIDIDHFKQVNDRHGHLLGDQALRAVAEVIANGVRQGDVAVRYGGDEFLLVLPSTPLTGAFEVAERIRVAAAQLALPFALTLSIGLAAGDPAVDQPEQVFERADQALYRAKSSGRNKLVADDDAQWLTRLP
jgi:diguanylate cyclase (GGDEF)-like protein